MAAPLTPEQEAEIERLLTELEAAGARARVTGLKAGWRPINDEAKNGSDVLLLLTFGRQVVASWDRGSTAPGYRWLTLDGPSYSDHAAVGWMPLPAARETEQPGNVRGITELERKATDAAFWNSVTVVDEGFEVPAVAPTQHVTITVTLTADEAIALANEIRRDMASVTLNPNRPHAPAMAQIYAELMALDEVSSVR